MGSSEEAKTRPLNVGEIPKDAKDAIDEAFHTICAVLKKHGRELIPKKMLYSAAIFHFLNPQLELGRKEATEHAIDEFIQRIQTWWEEHGGELKDA